MWKRISSDWGMAYVKWRVDLTKRKKYWFWIRTGKLLNIMIGIEQQKPKIVRYIRLDNGMKFSNENSEGKQYIPWDVKQKEGDITTLVIQSSKMYYFINGKCLSPASELPEVDSKTQIVPAVL